MRFGSGIRHLVHRPRRLARGDEREKTVQWTVLAKTARSVAGQGWRGKYRVGVSHPHTPVGYLCQDETKF